MFFNMDLICLKGYSEILIDYVKIWKSSEAAKQPFLYRISMSLPRVFKCWCNTWSHDPFQRELEQNKKQKIIDVIRSFKLCSFQYAEGREISNHVKENFFEISYSHMLWKSYEAQVNCQMCIKSIGSTVKLSDVYQKYRKHRQVVRSVSKK